MMGKSAKVACLIFLGTYSVYEANFRPIASGDSVPAALIPFSILTDHTLQLDRFEPLLQGASPFTPYYLHEKDHHFYSTYPIAEPILLTPLYIPIWLAADPGGWETAHLVLASRLIEKILAGALAAASAAFLFLLLDRLTRRRNALILTAAYAFGTSVWTISSQALWQHSAGGLLLVLALFCLERWSEDRSSLWLLLLAGFWTGLAAAVRIPNVFLACAVALVLILQGAGLRALAAFLAPVTGLGLVAASWNFWLFHDLRGASGVPMSAHPLDGLAGLLFSPARGLLVYTPFVVLAAAGAGALWKGGAGHSMILAVSVLFCFASLALVSFWGMWWGGHCWGPRLLTEMVPFLILLMVPGIDAVMANRGLRTMFACLLLYSISIQFVGAFFYPKGNWDGSPVNADMEPRRFWDWADNPVRRSVQGGFDSEPYTIVFAAALHGRSAAIRKIRENGYKGF
jgi:hypothetical protein